MTAPVMEILVRGRLGPDLIMALDGFRVENPEPGLTRVTGPMTDQAKLFGILDMLYGLHIEVISVNPLGGPGGRPAE